ncbi:MAG: hypothetical protein HY257_12050 [Chloroflexi bacterium]|nr:hypothetical protein [Chloroflexota bacterium]
MAHPVLRARLTLENDATARVKRSVYGSTLAMAFFLAPTLLLVPQIFPDWLLYFYAFMIAADWLFWNLFSTSITYSDPNHAPPSARATRIAAYFDSMPHAAFVIAALFLLALTPAYLLLNQLVAAERIANWAYGFLILAVSIAVLQLIAIPERVREWNQHHPQLAMGFLIFLFSFVGAVLADIVHTVPEVSFIVDVNPNYLANRVVEKDIIISDNPKLRLRTIPTVGSFLDLLPNQRGITLWDDLSRSLQDKRRVFWVSASADAREPHPLLSTFLKSNGCLDEIPETVLPVRLYEMRAPLTRPRVLPPSLSQSVPDAFDPIQFDFGAIQIAGARVEPRVCSHDAVAVAIRWKLMQASDNPLKVSLRLLDDQKRQIQANDFFIEDIAKRKTDEWGANTQNDSYYLVSVPLGTPPGNYAIVASVYTESAGRLRVANRDTITLGNVEVYRAEMDQADPYKTDQEAALVNVRADARTGLRLNAYGISDSTILPGENLRLTLRWRAQLDSLPAFQIQTRLVQANRVIAQARGAPVDNHYPTNLWHSGEFVNDIWDLRVPPETSGGKARVEVEVEGGKTFYLADVNIPDIPHSFQSPAMKISQRATFEGIGELSGYDLDRTQVAANGGLALTLYWRANAPKTIDKDYTVFAQLLAPDGQVLAQSDSTPAKTSRPTRGWVNGEYIADQHTLALSDSPFRGDATLIVGLYDPQTLERAPVKDTINNFVKLPTIVRVTAP